MNNIKSNKDNKDDIKKIYIEDDEILTQSTNSNQIFNLFDIYHTSEPHTEFDSVLDTFTNDCNNSWAKLVNSELGDSISEKELVKSKVSDTPVRNIEKKEHTALNTSEIMALQMESLTDTQLLEYQTYIAGQLRKYFKQCIDKNEEIDYQLHTPKVIWLADVSKYFSNKQNLKYNLHKPANNIDPKFIPRSSYKFCEFGHDCQFNYGNKAGCYAQHFVHNLIFSDIVSLSEYLLNCNKNATVPDMNEILKSINTISYVINHMYEELSAISFYSENKTMLVKKESRSNKNKKHSSNKKQTQISIRGNNRNKQAPQHSAQNNGRKNEAQQNIILPN